MKPPRTLLALILLTAATSFGQPVVNSIVNNYSYIPAGLPSFGIAQGSIFVIFGTGLATASSPLQSVPLKTTLDGVSVQFNIQGTTTQALLYYVSPTQIGGILPSATPVGYGFLTVTSGAQTSAPGLLRVVQSAVGILTLGGAPPFGPANATDGGKVLFQGFYAANPGDTVTFYGTGAGPVSGDESVLQTPQNLSSIPLEFDIGGVPATVSYHGRSIYPGLDQFNVVIPPGALGCNVSVVARSGNFVSNVPTIPIAASGRTCTDNLSGVTVFSSTTTATGESFNSGSIGLSANTLIQPSGSSAPPSIMAGASGGAIFTGSPATPGETVTNGGNPPASLGGCSLITYADPATPPPVSTAPSPIPGPALLNAGPGLNFTGPNGVASIQRLPGGTYNGPLSLITGQTFIPSTGGTFTVDNGSGGPDIGPFHQQIAFPPPLILTNAAALGATIDRTKPLTVQWTGGSPTSFVTISGGTELPVTQSGLRIGAQFSCTAPAAAGQFTIPSWVLMTLSAQAATPGAPTLAIRSQYSIAFTAPSLDSAVFTATSAVNLLVAYQ